MTIDEKYDIIIETHIVIPDALQYLKEDLTDTQKRDIVFIFDLVMRFGYLDFADKINKYLERVKNEKRRTM